MLTLFAERQLQSGREAGPLSTAKAESPELLNLAARFGGLWLDYPFFNVPPDA